MKLYNTLTRKIEELRPLDDKTVRIYSCGPTVYDHAHIGNLIAYIYSDTVQRALIAAGYEVKRAMNYTDVDDKTIRRSQEKHPDDEPRDGLRKLTDHYIDIFLKDMQEIGNDTKTLQFLRATDTIEDMQSLIVELLNHDFAYVTDDGIYFSIEAYKKAGHTYGQLSPINSENTSKERIDNDEYDKESVHDFALWKKQKDSEPAWDFDLPDGKNMAGRPGWHIECSAMSRKALGQPFDVHTGGVDLIFPHHENEIAQSTALESDPRMAQFFFESEHMLVDGKKMSKSLGNFYKLEDIVKKGYDPLAFRLLVLQSHYRSQTNFSWESLETAQNRLNDIRAWADLRHQPSTDVMPDELDLLFKSTREKMLQSLQDDLKTPSALSSLDKLMNYMAEIPIPGVEGKYTDGTLALIDTLLGLDISNRPDITDEQKQIILDREKAREVKDWSKADDLRDKLEAQRIGLRDTPHGAIWYRLANQP